MTLRELVQAARLRGWATPFASLVVAACVTIAYFPGLAGPFVFDDHENITGNTPVALTSLAAQPLLDALLANDSGPFGRPLASLSFALNHYFAGNFDSAFSFKVTNLAIHIVNAGLVYLLLLALTATPRLNTAYSDTQRRAIAGIAATLWAIHPIQLTSVLYVVQRMTSLSATFVLAGALIYLHGRMRLSRGEAGSVRLMVSGLLGGMLLGMAAKETAVLLPMYMVVVEALLFRWNDLTSAAKRRLMLSFIVVLAVPLCVLLLFLTLHSDFLTTGYAARDFSPWQRVITEGRILWMYVALFLAPAPSYFGLFHDAVEVSQNLLTPLTTVLAIGGWLVALAYVLYRPQEQTPIKFAIAWFLIGHSPEASFLGLDLAHEHRNYLPSVGPLFAVVASLANLFNRLEWKATAWRATTTAFIIVLAFSTWVRAGDWSDLATLASATARDHPDSPRANNFAARVSLIDRKDTVSALDFTLRGLALRPREAGFHIDLHVLLAILSKDIQRQLTAAPGEQRARGVQRVRITGLDQPLAVTTAAGSVTLVHPNSDFATVTRLLKDGVLSAHAVIALEDLARCVMRPPHACSALANATETWYRAALQNSEALAMHRSLVAASAAQLAASRGDVALALEHINQATRLTPGQLSFRLRTVSYLLQLKKTAEAEAVFSTVRSTNWPRADLAANRDTIERLERQFFKQKGAAPTGSLATHQ